MCKLRPLLRLGLLAAELKVSPEGGDTGLQGLPGNLAQLAAAAAVGQKGLAINDPQQMHQLRLYQGGITISALQVACVYYVGVQLLLAGAELPAEEE